MLNNTEILEFTKIFVYNNNSFNVLYIGMGFICNIKPKICVYKYIYVIKMAKICGEKF